MELKPAHTLTMEALAALFNAAFDGYVGGSPSLTSASIARFIARENVDLDLSQIIFRDDQPVGFAYVSRQGWSSRLAAFGIIAAASHQGVGTAAMQQMIEQARARGDQRYELEVIEQNPRAIRLYQGVGFEIVRRLISVSAKAPQPDADADTPAELQPLDILEIAKLVMQHGASDLPWDVSGTAIARLAPPLLGFRLDQAYAVISDPSAEVIALRALLVPPEARRQGQATRLINTLFARYPNKTWTLPAVMPEEIVADRLTRFGFARGTISQWQMRIML